MLMRRTVRRSGRFAAWTVALAAALLVGGCCKKPVASEAAKTAPPPAPAPAAKSSAEAMPELDRFQASELDTTKDPCVDFYAYACSKWKTSHPIPADLPSTGTWTPLYLWNQMILREAMERAAADPNAKGVERQVGDFWTSCMDVEGRTEHGMQWLDDALKPVDQMRSKKELPDVLAHLHATLMPGYEPGNNQTHTALLGYAPSQDLIDASKVVGSFDQAGLSLFSRDYYLKDDEKSKQIREKFHKHLVRMFKLLGDDDAAAAREADAVFAIEMSLAKAHMNTVDRRDPEKTYHKMTPAELEKAMPDFDVAEYLKAARSPKSSFYIVSTLEFLPALDEQIKTRSLDELKSYLRWWVIQSAASKTTPEMEQADFDFFRTELMGVPKMLPQWRRCVSSANRYLGEAVGQEYVKIAFPPESKAKAIELMEGIRTALKQDIGKQNWMAESTKKQALAKLDAMIQKVGYPDKWRDYSSVKVVANNYLSNVEQANSFEFHRELNKINKPVDKMEWYMTPPTINAYNDPQNNSINFPAGILQLPYFSPSQSDADNYGDIGATIGHEIIHGFDDQGRKFDAKGNLRDWWTDSDAKAYEQRGSCLVAQYTHPVPALGPDVHTDGKQTLGEDTADNGGIHLAMMALENLYKKEGKSLDTAGEDGLTPRQRFYASYAYGWCESSRPDRERMQITTDPHSLPQYRVNTVLSNQADFAKAFGCKAGQPMVAAPACRVW
jgi:putative endopeptidase